MGLTKVSPVKFADQRANIRRAVELSLIHI